MKKKSISMKNIMSGIRLKKEFRTKYLGKVYGQEIYRSKNKMGVFLTIKFGKGVTDYISYSVSTVKLITEDKYRLSSVIAKKMWIKVWELAKINNVEGT